MPHLNIRDITFDALERSFHVVQRQYSMYRLGPKEVAALMRILFDDAHRWSDQLVDHLTVRDYVYAKLKSWGYIKTDPSGPNGNHHPLHFYHRKKYNFMVTHSSSTL